MVEVPIPVMEAAVPADDLSDSDACLNDLDHPHVSNNTVPGPQPGPAQPSNSFSHPPLQPPSTTAQAAVPMMHQVAMSHMGGVPMNPMSAPFPPSCGTPLNGVGMPMMMQQQPPPSATGLHIDNHPPLQHAQQHGPSSMEQLHQASCASESSSAPLPMGLRNMLFQHPPHNSQHHPHSLVATGVPVHSHAPQHSCAHPRDLLIHQHVLNQMPHNAGVGGQSSMLMQDSGHHLMSHYHAENAACLLVKSEGGDAGKSQRMSPDATIFACSRAGIDDSLQPPGDLEHLTVDGLPTTAVL